MKKQEKSVITFSVDKETKSRLNEISENSGLKLTQIMRSAVEDYLNGGANRPVEVTHLCVLISLLLERDDLPEDYKSKTMKHYNEMIDLKAR